MLIGLYTPATLPAAEVEAVPASALAPAVAAVETSAPVMASPWSRVLSDQLHLLRPVIKGEMVNGHFIVTSASGQFCGGSFKARGHMNLSSGNGPQKAEITLTDVQLPPLCAALKIPDEYRTTGEVSATIKVEWDGDNETAVFAGMNGNAQVELSNCVVTNEYLLKALAQAAGVEAPGALSVNKSELNLSIQDGQVRVIEHTLDSPEVKVRASGTIQLDAAQADLTCQLQIDESLAEQSTQLQLPLMMTPGMDAGSGENQAAEGYVSLPPLLVKGSLTAPVINFALPTNSLHDNPDDFPNPIGKDPAQLGVVAWEWNEIR